jgi:PBP1b-binding outer membrane lipoprotein LpoB
MKLILLSMFCLMGCAHSLPPENYGITVTVSKKPAREVTVSPIKDLPKVVGEPQTEVVYVVDEESALSAEQFSALSKAIEEAVNRDSCKCIPGDPLCSCIAGDSPEIKLAPR